MTFRTWMTAGFLVALSAPSCSSVDRRTQITVALATETEIPKDLDTFSVRVFASRTGDLRFSQDYYPKTGREFPTTLAVIPADEDSVGGPLRVELEGRKGDKILLRRQAVLSYVEGRNLLLSMPLRMACFDFKDCGVDATCSGGQCVALQTSSAALPDYEDAYVFARNGAACFDEQTCLANAQVITVADDCTFPLPGGNANVAIQWEAAKDRILALDGDDAQEGWMRLDDTHGRLSQGACDSHFQRKDATGALLVTDWAEQVYVSRVCPTKSTRLPACFSVVTQHAGVGAVLP